ncbi:MAG TPA: class I SAM-dependent methyltransferase [Anaerolineales bacterium]
MDSDVKQQVREFYDQVGWKLVEDGVYQNAHYEDLRPVSHEYIHRCHLRLARCLKQQGRFLLDAGSGPIQYPEYLEYSRGYAYRVCADISMAALREARKRIGSHGLFVVSDVANLPFKPGVFDGVVSLHTIHHLPEQEHLQAYGEVYRVLAPHSMAAIVNGWPSSHLMDLLNPLLRLANGVRNFTNRGMGRKTTGEQRSQTGDPESSLTRPQAAVQKGTFTNRHDVAWVKAEIGGRMPVEIRVWRSVSVRWLRAFIHPWLGGRLWLRLLFGLEEGFPHYFGENGQYPLIVIRKPE